MHTHTHTHRQTPCYTDSHTYTNTHTHTLLYRHIHTYTHTHTHTHTHTYTNTPCWPAVNCLVSGCVRRRSPRVRPRPQSLMKKARSPLFQRATGKGIPAFLILFPHPHPHVL